MLHKRLKAVPLVRKNNKGFTLAELLIVIAIIAILAAIAIPVYNNVVEKARRTKDEANIRILLDSFRIALMDDEAQYTSTAVFNPGTIYYRSTGVLDGIGVALTERIASVLGDQGRTYSGTGGRGYKFAPLTSNVYQTAANAPQFYFQWHDTAKKDYLTVVHKNPLP